MPKGTPVERQYRGLRKEGFSKESAARISQANTGLSLATGKPPKGKKKKKKPESIKRFMNRRNKETKS
jgi:hypothetical protein